MSFEDSLLEILSSSDFDVFDRKCFENILDYLRSINRLYANLIMLAFDAGVFRDISAQFELDQEFFNEHIQCLKKDYGLTAGNAEWTVNACCTTYGANVLMLDCVYNTKFNKLDIGTSKTSIVDSRINTNYSVDAINMSDYSKGAKLPKSIVHRVIEAEKINNIDDMTLTVSNGKSIFDEFEETIKVVGEITSSGLPSNILIYLMVYNNSNELIGASFRTKIEKEECKGFASFTSSVSFPEGELVSKIVIRPVRDPSTIWKWK